MKCWGQNFENETHMSEKLNSSDEGVNCEGKGEIYKKKKE